MKSVFVSSTFRDMDYERDVLNRRIGPNLNHQLKSFNQSVRILDLRWGIDTAQKSEQEASELVSRICNAMVEKCKPYVVVLLGDRYGYVPEGDAYSVTHREIIRGVFENTRREHIYIYLREADYASAPEEARQIYIEQSPEGQRKLAELKRSLLEEYPDRCRHYSASWSEAENCLVSHEFERLVQQDLEQEFVAGAQAVVYRSALHRQLCENETLVEDNIRFAYSNQEKLASEISNILQSERPYGILGEGGAGKSVYLSLLCAALRRTGCRVDVLFCGDNAFSASVRNTAELVLKAMTEAAGGSYDYEAGAALSYEELIAALLEKRTGEKCIVLLDAVDKCDAGMVKFLDWCRTFLSDCVQIVFTSRPIEEILKNADSFDLSDMEYDRDDLRAMAQRILEQYGKSLADELLEQALDKVHTPLTLNILLQMLVDLNADDYTEIRIRGGDSEAINAYLRQKIRDCPEDGEELVAEYLGSLISRCEFPEINIVLLASLSLCETGLEAGDLLKLIERYLAGRKEQDAAFAEALDMKDIMDEMDWMINALHNLDEGKVKQPARKLLTMPERILQEFQVQFTLCLRTRENGRLDISHDIIRQTIRRLEDCKQVAMLVLSVMDEKEEWDDLDVMNCLMLSYYAQSCEMLLGVLFLSLLPKRIVNSMKQTLEQTPDNPWEPDEAYRNAPPEEQIQADRLPLVRQGLFKLFCMDEGEFLLNTGRACQTKEAVDGYQTILSNSLASMNDYIDEDLAMKMAEVMMWIPLHHPLYNRSLDETMVVVTGFLFQHGISAEKRDAFEEACRREKAESASPEDDGGETSEALLRRLYDKSLAPEARWAVFSRLGFRLTSVGLSNPQKTERIFLGLAEELRKGKFDFGIRTSEALPTIQMCLGNVYVMMEHWREAVAAYEQVVEFYENRYRKTPVAGYAMNYRQALRGLNSTLSIWASMEETNLSLWTELEEKARKEYDHYSLAMAHGISDQEQDFFAASALSLGCALVELGDSGEGARKMQEGMSLFGDIGNPKSVHFTGSIAIYATGVKTLMEGGHIPQMVDVTEAFCTTLSKMEKMCDAQTMRVLSTWSQGVLALLANTKDTLQEQGDAAGVLAVVEVGFHLGIIIGSYGASMMKKATIYLGIELGDLLRKQEEYQRAYEAYLTLLEALETRGLLPTGEDVANALLAQIMGEDSSGVDVDELITLLAVVYIRVLICLRKLGRDEERVERMEQVPTWARLVAGKSTLLTGRANDLIRKIADWFGREEGDRLYNNWVSEAGEDTDSDEALSQEFMNYLQELGLDNLTESEDSNEDEDSDGDETLMQELLEYLQERGLDGLLENEDADEDETLTMAFLDFVHQRGQNDLLQETSFGNDGAQESLDLDALVRVSSGFSSEAEESEAQLDATLKALEELGALGFLPDGGEEDD